MIIMSLSNVRAIEPVGDDTMCLVVVIACLIQWIVCVFGDNQN
jgi:hypothetical protein